MTSAIENRAPSNHGDAMSQRDRTAPQATPTRHADAILKIIDVLVRQLSDSPLSTRLALTRLIETLSKILDIPPLPQETLRDFAKRLSAAIEAMPPAARVALEKQLGQRALVTALRLLLDTLRNEAPPALPRPANLPLKAFEVIDRQKAAPYPAQDAAPARTAPPNRAPATTAAAAQGMKSAAADPAGIRPPVTQPSPASSAAPAPTAPQRAAAIATTAEIRVAETRRAGLSSQGPAASASALQAEIVVSAPSQASLGQTSLDQAGPSQFPQAKPTPSSPLTASLTAAPPSMTSPAAAEVTPEQPTEPQPAEAQEADTAVEEDAGSDATPVRTSKTATASKDGIPLLKAAIDYLSRTPEAVSSLLRIVTALRTQDETTRPPAVLLAAAREWGGDEAAGADGHGAAVHPAALMDASAAEPARRDPAAARPGQSVPAQTAQDHADGVDGAQPSQADLEGLAEKASMPELTETDAMLLPLGRRPAAAPALLDETNMDRLISALAEEADPDRSDAPAHGAHARATSSGEAPRPQDEATARAVAERNVALPPSRPQDLGDMGILRPSENVMQDWIALAFAAASLPPKDAKPRRPDNLPAERSQPLGKDERDGQKRRGQQRDPAQSDDENDGGTDSHDGKDGGENAGDAYALYRHMAGFDPEEKPADA